MRAGLIAASAVMAALSIFSLANPSGSKHNGPVLIKPTAQTQTSTTTATRTSSHHTASKPKPKPKPLPPATQMTNPAQAATPNPASSSLSKMVGQMMMVKFTGTTPDAELLRRIHDGEVGAVILYSENITSQSQVAQLDAELQHAALSGGNPPLLISTDQEGGQVKRLPWAAPNISPASMGADGASTSRQQGADTGHALSAAGINVNLAPVADVAHSAGAFIWRQGRSFGMSPSTVTPAVAAFALGMEHAGVAPTAKHFPGVGGAMTDTDFALEQINLTGQDIVPYRTLIAENVPIIMVGTAVYPNFDPSQPAALSHQIVTGYLRGRLGFRGVTMSDDLERPTRQPTPGAAAVIAANAGIDILLVCSTESGGASAYQAVLAAAKTGQISQQTMQDAYGRILQLKSNYATP